MMNTDIAQKTNISQYETDLEKERSSLLEQKESLGYGDVNFEDFIEELLPEDEVKASQIVELQEKVNGYLNDLKIFKEDPVSDDKLLDTAKKKEFSTDSIKTVCKRIHQYKECGSLAEGDRLKKKLQDASKKFGIAADTINDLLKREAPKKTETFDDPNLPFEVLGYTKDRKVLLWNQGQIMEFPLQALNADLKILWDIKEEEMKAVKRAFRKKGMIDLDSPLSTGIWQLPEWKKEGKILIVSGQNATFFQDGKSEQLKTPVIGDQVITYEKRKWVNLDDVKDQKPELAKTFFALKKILSQWPWKEDNGADWMAAFIMILPFQQLMRWRPWLWLIGDTACGKSALFEEFLERLYPYLVKRTDKSTAHAVAQAVGNTAKILVLDEFEKYIHNDDVLNLLKVATRGGTKTQGTTSQKERSYALHHMPMLGAIYMPLGIITDQSQRNRIIRFDLGKIEVQKELVSDEEMRTLGVQTIAAVIHNWRDIEAGTKEIQTRTDEIIKRFDGELAGRGVENFMYAASLLKKATGKEYDVPNWARQEQVKDGRSLLDVIMRAKVKDIQLMKEFLVIDLVRCASIKFSDNDPDNEADITAANAERILKLCGIKLVESKTSGTTMIALEPSAISKRILHDEPQYKGQDVSEPLKRLEGAIWKKTKWSPGNSSMGVQLPIALVIPDQTETGGA